jgi:arabinose-5-phosphate isomerase
MTEKALGCVGILDAGRRLVGIITDGDLRRNMGERLFSSTVDPVMTPRPQTIRPQALAAEALGRMNAPARPITSLFVVDDEEQQVLGILHIHDLLRAGVA